MYESGKSFHAEEK